MTTKARIFLAALLTIALAAGAWPQTAIDFGERLFPGFLFRTPGRLASGSYCSGSPCGSTSSTGVLASRVSSAGSGLSGFDLRFEQDRTLTFDYDGDGRGDLFGYRPGGGAAWVLRSMGTGSFVAVYAEQGVPGNPGTGIAGYDLRHAEDRALALDYNGDGRDDLFLYRPGSGAAWVVRSNGDGTFTSVYGEGGSPANPGGGIAGFDLHHPEDRVLVFDYDGDGRDDLFLYRPGSGAAWVARSNGDAFGFASVFTAVYGEGGNPSSPGSGIAGFDLHHDEDRVLVFDYDGDGRHDLFLYRPGSGAAWVARSNGNGTFSAAYGEGGNPSSPGDGIAGFDLHHAEDRALSFDHDGDGRDDLFLYRPGSGAAWVARSNGDDTFTGVYGEGGNPSQPGKGIAGFDLARPEDRALVFDYDGDDLDDLFLYRPGSGAAWVARSNGSGAFAAAYGDGGNPCALGSGMGGFDLHRAEDRPLAFDFDADGDGDLFFYRPGLGVAWVVRSHGDADLFTRAYGNRDELLESYAGEAGCRDLLTLSTGKKIPYYRTHPLHRGDDRPRRALIVIHGFSRTADNYFRRGVNAARAEDVWQETLVVAPRFQTAAERTGDDEHFWSRNGWSKGNPSTDGTYLSSYAVIDEIYDRIQRNFPNVQTVAVAGHSAGGQFVNRYLAGGRGAETSALSSRFFVMNPSSYLYMNEYRAKFQDGFGWVWVVPSECPRGEHRYDSYKYGLDKLNPYMGQVGVSKMFSNLSERDGYYFLGGCDFCRDDSLDDSCAADKQGRNRLQRGMLYEDHTRLFPAWAANVSFEIVPDVGHSGEGMFRAQDVRDVLFFDP